MDLRGDVVFKSRPDLHAIAKKLPKNVKYTFADVQNEMIGVLRLLIERSIVKQVEKAGLYTLMVDVTTDKYFLKIVSIVCRYIVEVDAGIQVVEHVV